LRWQGVCYRGHDPRWAWSPTSGEGAAAKGGRFNPVGTPALYLALTIEGMLTEMGHGFGHRIDLAALSCAWAYDRANGRTPASWDIAARLIAKGAAGILVPSFANSARPDKSNLVLWRWGESLPHLVRVHDPAGRLPKDQSSWLGSR
jgi:RES domain-containing protein